MAARKLSELSDAVRSLVIDRDVWLKPADFDNAVGLGITRLCQFRPRYRIKEITGDGTAFRFAAPADYQAGFSTVRKVLYPYDSTSKDLAPEISKKDWQMVLLADDTHALQIRTFIPESGKKLHMYYTCEHEVTTTTSTLKSRADEDSIVYWAAAIALRLMAAAANASQDIEQQVSASNKIGRGAQYIKLAERYEEESGLLAGAALGWGATQTGTAETTDYLTH